MEGEYDKLSLVPWLREGYKIDAYRTKKKNVAGARFRQPSSAPTTKPNQPDEPLILRFDDCCH